MLSKDYSFLREPLNDLHYLPSQLTLASNMLSSSDGASPDFPEPFFAADFSLLAGSFRMYFTGYTSAFFPHSSYHKFQNDMIISWSIHNYYDSDINSQWLVFIDILPLRVSLSPASIVQSLHF